MKQHYILHEPGLGFPMLAVALNLLVLVGIWQWSGWEKQRVSVAWDQHATARSDVPRIAITSSGQVLLNQQSVSKLEELQFKLSALSSAGNQLLLSYDLSVPAGRLAELLQICSQAGFTSVSMQPLNGSVN